MASPTGRARKWKHRVRTCRYSQMKGPLLNIFFWMLCPTQAQKSDYKLAKILDPSSPQNFSPPATATRSTDSFHLLASSTHHSGLPTLPFVSLRSRSFPLFPSLPSLAFSTLPKHHIISRRLGQRQLLSPRFLPASTRPEPLSTTTTLSPSETPRGSSLYTRHSHHSPSKSSRLLCLCR